VPFIRITNLSRNSIYLDLEDLRLVNLPRDASEGTRTRLQDQDVLISITADIGIIGYVSSYVPKPAYINQHIALVRFDSSDTNPKFISYFLASEKPQKLFRTLTDAGAKAGMNLTAVRKIPIVLPPTKSEQDAIAEVLGNADALIESLEQLIAAKTEFKRGLMQQLLTGRKRFNEFKGQEWKLMRLSDFAKLTLRLTPKPGKPFKSLGIRSHGKGTFLKEGFEPEKIELTELYEVKENDLIVNITFAWEGAIAIAGAADSGALVSHRFPTYVFDTERAIPEYFRHVIVQKKFVEKLGLISPGGAGRNRVLSKKDFANLEVLMPSVEEQRKIADVLNAYDRELDLLREQLAEFKKQKQGLMQKLLSGQIRVNVNEAQAIGV
jgi:type I restriction enzyme S subunit